MTSMSGSYLLVMNDLDFFRWENRGVITNGKVLISRHRSGNLFGIIYIYKQNAIKRCPHGAYISTEADVLPEVRNRLPYTHEANTAYKPLIAFNVCSHKKRLVCFF